MDWLPRVRSRTEQTYVWPTVSCTHRTYKGGPPLLICSVVVPVLAVCVCGFYMFVNAPNIQEFYSPRRAEIDLKK